MGQRNEYTKEFRRQALEKAYMRGSRKVESIASDLNINLGTLKTWMRRDKKRSEKKYSVDSKRPQDRSRAERLELLMESHGLDEEGLNAFCRKRGIFVHHLRQWREEFEAGTVSDESSAQTRELEKSKKELERELRRKDKALAEAAALLVLKKKYESLWEDEDD